MPNDLFEMGLLSSPDDSTAKGFKDALSIKAIQDDNSGDLSLYEMGLLKPSKKEGPPEELVKEIQGRMEENITRQPELVDDMSFMEAIESGFQESVLGLSIRGELPEKRLNKEGGLFDTVVSAIATEVSDIPVYLGAVKAGGIAGTAVAPGVGTAVGAVGGGIAVPAALRGALIAGINQGEIQNFDDAVELVKAAGIEAGKATLVALGTLGAGKGARSGVAKKILQNKNFSNLTSKSIEYGSEFLGQTAGMTAMRSALEGELPTMNTFAESAITMLAVNGAERVVTLGGKSVVKQTKKTVKTLQDAYVKSGIKPEEMVTLSKADPSINEDIVGGNPTPRALANPDKPLKQEVSDMLQTVQFDEPKVKATLNDSASKFYMKTLDSLHPVRKMMDSLSEGNNFEQAANIYQKATMNRNSFNVVDTFLDRGAMDFGKTKKVGKSFGEIMKPVKSKGEELTAYMVAKRGKELEARGKKTGLKGDADSLIAKVEAESPDIVKAAKELGDFQDNVLKYYKESGFIDDADFARIKDLNQDYIPFSRVYEESLGKAKGKTVTNSLKSLTEGGSERDIFNPLKTVVKNTETMINLAEKNRVTRDIVDFAASREGGENYFEKVTNVKKVKVKDGDIDLEVFRADNGSLNGDEIAVYRDGKKEVYKVKDPDMVEALDSLNPTQMNAVVRAASHITRWKRAGITNNLTFGVTNFLRAEMSATINSPDAYIPLYDGLRGLTELSVAKLPQLKGKGAVSNYQKRIKSAYDTWLASGGGSSTMIDIDQRYIRQGVDRYLREAERNSLGRSAAENIGQVSRAALTYLPKKTLDFLEATSTFAENAPRFRQFQKSIKSGKDPIVAAYDSAEIATNFSKKGSDPFVNGLRQTSAFLGATSQSYDKMVRQLASNPRDTALRSLTMLTVPSVTLHLTHHYEEDENGNLVQAEWYKNLPDYQRRLFWTFNIGTAEEPVIMRMPKPYDYGVLFATAAEDFADFLIDKDVEAAKTFGNNLFENFVPSYDLFIPDVVTPFIEIAANHSMFRDAPIVPKSKEGLLSELQASTSKTQTSRDLSKLLSEVVPVSNDNRFISPSGLEHFVESWTGSLGISTLGAVDDILQESGVLEKRPQSKAEAVDIIKAGLASVGIMDPNPDVPVTALDIPVLKSFYIRQGLSAKPINDFYNNRAENAILEKSLNAVKNKDPLSYEYMFNKVNEKGGIVDMGAYEKSIRNALDYVYKISNIPDKDMPVREKQELLKPLYQAITTTAIAANKTFEIQRQAMEDLLQEYKKNAINKQEQ